MQSFDVYNSTESGKELLGCFDDVDRAIDYARDANKWFPANDSVFVVTEWGDTVYIV